MVQTGAGAVSPEAPGEEPERRSPRHLHPAVGEDLRIHWRRFFNTWLEFLHPVDYGARETTTVERLRERVTRRWLNLADVALLCATVLLITLVVVVVALMVGAGTRVADADLSWGPVADFLTAAWRFLRRIWIYATSGTVGMTAVVVARKARRRQHAGDVVEADPPSGP